MSFDAIRWALEQPVAPAMTKFLLVAMADCVNSDGAEMVCWPSYAFLARRTGMNAKTVEAAVFRLKQDGYLVDTGRRAGDTGKVVVYRLNDPETGCIKQGPREPNANGTRPNNDPENGGITPSSNPPKSGANPPKSDDQSPQKVEETPPDLGSRTNKGTKNRTRKEPGRELSSIPGVSSELFADWLVARKQKPVTPTALAGLEREATKAGLTVAEAIAFCCEQDWRGFNAGWYADRVAQSKPKHSQRPAPAGKFAAAGRTIFGNPQSEVIDVETN